MGNAAPLAPSRPTDLVGDDLLMRYHSTRDPALRDAAFLHYRGLARMLARRMVGRGVPTEDLLQVADLGLVGAIDRFDPERGTAFVGFAVVTISGELKKHFRDHGWAVKVPRPLKELCVRLRPTIEELRVELGRAPTTAEVAAALGVSVVLVLEAAEASAGYRPASTATDDGETRATEATTRQRRDDEGVLDERIVVQQLLHELPQRERNIIYLRYFEDLTQSEIAAVVGLSQMHVSRLLRRSIERLRAAVEAPAVMAS